MNNQFEQLKQCVRTMFDQSPIEKHPFIQVIQQKQLSPSQVKDIAIQMYFVVNHFPRFLSAILTQIPDYKLRMPLVENLYEEHGKMNTQFVHVETYKSFLKGIGITDEIIANTDPSIAVIAYNRSITDLCLHYPYEEGLAALGVIEEIVARVSPIISQYIQNNYQDSTNMMIHFSDHETLDITHADEIYEVVALLYNGEQKERVERGLQLGWYYHRRLYTDLLEMI
ncbi:TenA family transcriptional regulator [Shimazuella kribbensis]|uniref:TenA family transcriptional regulator n=1 Tax=Shimazuella kribbensis TaxID=139808 RepID=UPI0003F881E0|nr:iron-containing redox enzyme family protein [Shimazuella kribbensis]